LGVLGAKRGEGGEEEFMNKQAGWEGSWLGFSVVLQETKGVIEGLAGVYS